MFTKNSDTNKTINDCTRDELVYTTGFQNGVTKEHNKNAIAFVLFAISTIGMIVNSYTLGKAVGEKLSKEDKSTENKTEDKE